jgi:hypothetical protein
MSEQNNTLPPPDVELQIPNASHDKDNGKNEFYNGESV